MSAQTALDALADSLSLELSAPPGVGQAAQARLVPAPAGLELTEALPGTVKATWLSKDVLFKTAGTETAMNQVPPDLATLAQSISGAKPYLSSLGTFITPPTGAPGLLGQFVAELPAVAQTTLPVAVSVTWKAQDQAGADLPAAAFKVLSQDAGQASILFAPSIVEATGGVPAAVLAGSARRSSSRSRSRTEPRSRTMVRQRR